MVSYFGTHTQKVSMVCIHGEKKIHQNTNTLFPGKEDCRPARGKKRDPKSQAIEFPIKMMGRPGRMLRMQGSWTRGEA